MNQFTNNDQQLISSVLNAIDCIRSEKGLTISRLALDAGISENTIKYIFKKQSCPTIPTLTRLCDALGISLWQFFLLTAVGKVQPHQEYELLTEFEKLNKRHKELIIYIAKYLSE